MISVRDAAPADLPGMVALDALCFDPAIRYDLGTFRRLLNNPDILTRIALSDSGDLAGFSMVEVVLGRARYGHVVTIDVHPEVRRRRIGALLLDELHRAIVQKGIVKMILEVYTQNLGALDFYRFHGYRSVSLLTDYYGPGLDGFILMKDLSAP